MHHVLYLVSIVHAAAAYHQVGVDVVSYCCIVAGDYGIAGELGEIDVVAFFVCRNTLQTYF